MGFAIGPIPWRDIIHYADRAGLARDVAEAFVVIIKEMDAGYLEWQNKEQERIAAQKGQDQSGRGEGR